MSSPSISPPRPSPLIEDTTRTIDQLCLSTFNVRTDQREISDTRALEASIADRGLLQAINVHLMRGSRDQWGAFAGGRRYRAIRNLIAAGTLPRDWPVPVRHYVGFSDAELIELSISENYLRRDLREHELYSGVRKAHAKGHSVEEIARGLGQNESVQVARWLRMGQLAKPIFDAFVAEELLIEEARAYAATADQDLQRAVFAELQPLQKHLRTDWHIRKAMKVGDQQAGRMLRFVGDDVYRDAGGRFELDLFATEAEQRGRVVDDGLLRKLVDARQADTGDRIRARAGRADLRFVTDPPQGDYGTDHQLQVHPADGPGGDEGPSIVLPDGDIVARLFIDVNGQPQVDWWWSSRKAKFGNAKAARGSAPAAVNAPIRPGGAIGQQYDGARQAADAAIKQDEGLTQDTIQIFRSLHRVILRAAAVDDARAGGTASCDYLVWSQLRLALNSRDLASAIGVRGFSSSDGENEHARPHVAATAASRIWGQAITEQQRQSFMTGADLAAAFLDYRASPADVKRLAEAVAAGLAFERSLNADGYRVAAHDALAAELGVADPAGIREYWTPTEELIALLPKSQQLAIAEPFVERATFAPWSRLKSADITRHVVAVVTAPVTGATAGIRPALVESAHEWVHPLLQFGPADAGAAELAEAAE